MIPQPPPAPVPGPLHRRIAANQPPPPRWQPAWLRNRPAPKDMTGWLS